MIIVRLKSVAWCQQTDLFIAVFYVAVSGVPRHLDSQQIREDLLKLEDVQSVDELNVWALTGDKTAALVHLRLSE